MPQFTPKSEKELNEERLLPEGVYDAEVRKAEDATSKASGAPMIRLTVGVFMPDGTMRLVDDYLVFTDSSMFKISSFAKAFGIYEDYKAGNIEASRLPGLSGKVKIGIEPEGEFPAKNKVKNYIAPKAGEKASAPKPAASKPAKSPADPQEDEEVPF